MQSLQLFSKEYAIAKHICNKIFDVINDEKFWLADSMPGVPPSKIKEMIKHCATYTKDSDPIKTLKVLAAIIGPLSDKQKKAENLQAKFFVMIKSLAENMNLDDTQSIFNGHNLFINFNAAYQMAYPREDKQASLRS